VFELPFCERSSLRDGLAVEAVGYYDLITLAETKHRFGRRSLASSARVGSIR
jgi:hypothetical protein